jgi:crossover junction endodeoxyribonuclease RuvC
VRIFGIDPGSTRTGYGCVETDGEHHRLILSGAIAPGTTCALPEKLAAIHDGLRRMLQSAAPDLVAIESVFHARNVRSALVLGHARGVAMLAAVGHGVPSVEYSPAASKLAIAGYGRADKGQLQAMVKLLLGLDVAPTPHDAADALAVAICHAHSTGGPLAAVAAAAPRGRRSWRHVTEAELPRRQAP